MLTQVRIERAFRRLFEARAQAGIPDAATLPVPLARETFLAAAMFCDVPFNEGSYFEDHLIPVCVATIRLVPDNVAAHITAMHHDTDEDLGDFLTKYVRMAPILGYIFSDPVEEGIRMLSNPTISKRLPEEERIRRYQEHVYEAVEEPIPRAVKTGDFSVNAGRIAYAPPARQPKLARKYLGLYPLFIGIALEYGEYGAQVSRELVEAEKIARVLAAR